MTAPPGDPDQPRSRSAGAGVRLQRSGTMRRVTWGALGLFATSLLGLFLVAYFGGPLILANILGWGLAASPLLALLTAAAGTFHLRAGDSLRVDGADLVIRRARGDRRVPCADLTDGWVSPREGLVHLRTRTGDVYTAPIRDEAEGQALLEAAGLDASKRTLRMRLGPVDFINAMSWLLGPVTAIPLAELIGASLHMRGALSVPLAVVLFVLQFYLVRQTFGPAHIVIGADGIIVKQRLRARFIPFDRIRSIDVAPDHVTFSLTDGTSVRARARHLDATARATIEARVNAALAVRTGRGAEPSALAELDRGSRTAAAWRDALGALLRQDRGYRAARLTREQVLGVLDNPAAPAGRRIGAAMALAAAGDADAVTRIRVAAGSSANEKVRIALEHIAEGDIEAEAIDEAAAEEAARKA